MGAIIMKIGRMRKKGNIASELIILLLLSFVFFSFSTIKNMLIVEGSYAVKEQQVIFLEEDEINGKKKQSVIFY